MFVEVYLFVCGGFVCLRRFACLFVEVLCLFVEVLCA